MILYMFTGEAQPKPPTNLMVPEDDLRYDRATIKWTIPEIAYTPETYVVEYGTSMQSLDMRSMEQRNEAFEAENLMFSVPLTGLTRNTLYNYQVVATNSLGANLSATSDVQMFMTPDMRE